MAKTFFEQPLVETHALLEMVRKNVSAYRALYDVKLKSNANEKLK